MKILCPECNTSVVVDDGTRHLTCPQCHLTANLSQIGTSPGVAAAAVTRDLTGERFGGYTLDSLIGMGGMGVVYRAVRESDNETVALKILSCESVWKKDEFVKRFEREIKALERLDHPNIVRLLDSGRVGDDHFLVTEYVPGQNLAERLKSGPLDRDEVISVMSEVLCAIAYAHENGVIHRDIKPANIILSNGTVKVLDFGLAQISSNETALSSLTRTNLAMGTFNYLSPEQRTSAKSVDGRSDLFSLGVVLFEMLTGNLPLGNFQVPSKVRQGVDKRFDSVVLKSLASSPDERYPSAEAFQGELVGLTKSARRYWIPGAGSLAGVALLIAFIFGVVGGESEDGKENGKADIREHDIGALQKQMTPEPGTASPAVQAAQRRNLTPSIDREAMPAPEAPATNTVSPVPPLVPSASSEKPAVPSARQKVAPAKKRRERSNKAVSLGKSTDTTDVRKTKESAPKKVKPAPKTKTKSPKGKLSEPLDSVGVKQPIGPTNQSSSAKK